MSATFRLNGLELEGLFRLPKLRASYKQSSNQGSHRMAETGFTPRGLSGEIADKSMVWIPHRPPLKQTTPIARLRKVATT